MTGRNRRLLNEWKILEERFSKHKYIAVSVEKRNFEDVPTSYRVHYSFRSICFEIYFPLIERHTINLGPENPVLFF